MKRRLLAILLSVSMLASMMVLPAAAESSEEGTGVVGDITWTYTSDGTLTIELTHGSGTYDMVSFGPYGSAPWHDYAEEITTVVIESGVKSIGDYAFLDCSNLTSITIPDTVTEIEDNAFEGCTSLTTINIEDGSDTYTLVDGVLFSSDETELVLYPQGKSDTSYAIPDGVTSLADNAFYFCSNLQTLTIPDSLTDFDGSVFHDCSSLQSFAVESGSTVYSVSDGVLFNADGTELILYPQGKSATSYTIPDGVTSLAYEAFYDCNNLTSLTISEDVSSIGGRVFYTCTSLENIYVDDGNSSYKSVDGVLYNWNYSRLMQYPAGRTDTSYTVPDYINGNPVTIVANFAFYGSSLEEIILPDTLETMESYVFMYCSELEEITIPDGVTWTGYYMFYGCTSLESVTLPDSIDSIRSFAFYGCESLEEITIPDGVTTLSDSSFTYCLSLRSITIPDSVTELGYNLFAHCESLTDIVLPDGITEIPFYGFSGCYSLENITLPESLTKVCEYVFYNCTSLTEVTFPESIEDIADGAFKNCTSLTSIYFNGELPHTTSYIRYNSFYGVEATVYYPESATPWTDSEIEYCAGTFEWVSYADGELCTVSLYSDDTLKRTLSFISGETLELDSLPELEKAGYFLSGWTDEDGNDVEEDITVTGDLSLYADWALSYESYTDLDDSSSWYYEGVNYVIENGIMNGIGGTKFNPDGTCTRTDIVTILYRIAGEPDVSGETSSFTDVEADQWYTDAIIWAEENDITEGISADTFGVQGTLTREQFATFMYRYAKYMGYDVSDTEDLSTYPDADSVDDWAEDAMSWAVAVGLINGVQDNGQTLLAPTYSCTRSMTAVIIYRFDTNDEFELASETVSE